MSVTKVIIVLHSQHLDMIPFFFGDCKFFSGERVKIFWKNRENFLKKFFWSSLIFILKHGLEMGFESVLLANLPFLRLGGEDTNQNKTKTGKKKKRTNQPKHLL